jgi:hypothetical protein
MKNILNKLFLILFSGLAFPHFASGQDSSAFELKYEVKRIYPPVSVTNETLKEAQTLIDLNRIYPSSWVREYVSVEIGTINNGKAKNALSKNDTLSEEQKTLMNTADVGTGISVRAKYIPDNNLKNNDIKEIKFTLAVDPDSEASYPGGEQQLKQYLKVNAMDKIADSIFRKYNLTAIKFTIDEEGQVSYAHVSETSNDEITDDLLLDAIRNMPAWKPAEYANGHKTEQEFVLLVGDMESCAINQFRINRDGPAKDDHGQ